MNKYAYVLMSRFLVGLVAGSGGQLTAQEPSAIRNPGGLELLVADDHASPTLRVVLPGRPAADRAIEVIFPEHVTAVRRGSAVAEHLYQWRPGLRGDRPVWRRRANALEYERDLPGRVHLLARATLEADGVRFHYEFRNESTIAYDMIHAVTDPRLTDGFQDVRLERTYVHYSSGLALLAGETPARLTLPLDRWLPARYLASFTWPVPTERVERRADGITYYNTAHAVDQPFIATRSANGAWVVASFSRNPGNVWTNPELTCQHVDPQTVLPPGAVAILEMKILVMRGSVDDALQRAISQRDSLK